MVQCFVRTAVLLSLTFLPISASRLLRQHRHTIAPAAPPAPQEWSIPLNGSMSANPVLSLDKSTIYVPVNQTLLCLSTKNGQEVWNASIGKGAIRGLAVGQRGLSEMVYVNSDNKTMFAVDGATGILNWTYTPLGKVHGDPSVSADGKRLYVTASVGAKSSQGAPEQTLHGVNAVDAVHGRNIWRRAVSMTDRFKLSRSVIISKNGSDVYVMDYSFNVFGVDAGGNQTWTFQPDDAAPAGLFEHATLIQNRESSVVYAPAAQGVRAISTADGSELWNNSALGVPASSLLLSHDEATLYTLTNSPAGLVVSRIPANDGNVTGNVTIGTQAKGGEEGPMLMAPQQSNEAVAFDTLVLLDGEAQLLQLDTRHNTTAPHKRALPPTAQQTSQGSHLLFAAADEGGKVFFYVAAGSVLHKIAALP